MTDEEMAEEYFKSVCEDYNEELERTGKRHYWVGFDIKNAYLAGLQAGRPKWHKVADGDLPPVRTVVFVSGHLGDMKDLQGFDEWDGEKWLNDDMPGLVREAWCEIPQYTEE